MKIINNITIAIKRLASMSMHMPINILTKDSFRKVVQDDDVDESNESILIIYII